MRYTIIDSGLGGYCFYNNLQKNNFELFIDKEGFPYGNKDLLWLKERLIYLIDNIKTEGVIIACNTLSSLIYYYNLTFSKKIVDVIAPTISFLSGYTDKNIIILATKNTIKMDVYSKLLKRNVKYFDSTELIYKLEKELNYTEILKKTISEIDFYDVVVLGCTHLIKIKNEFRTLTNKLIISQDELV